MTKGIIAALLAAGLAVFLAPHARAQSLGLTKQFYNVSIPVPRSGYNGQAMANAFCRSKGYGGAPEFTAGMTDPDTARFSYINCVRYKP